MSYVGTTALFAPGPNPRAPAFPWRSDRFFGVDDTVRGGSSHSHMTIVQYPPAHRGEIVFSGFLDTTTLGGAGFASQAYSAQLPVTLSTDSFRGLRIVLRKEPNWSEPTPPTDDPVPGGGRGPVKSFVFQIKTQVPERRPDGRRESVVVWEWSFTIPTNGDEGSAGLNSSSFEDDFWVFDSTWDDFKPFYRGRPVEDDKAGPFEPEKTVEWSIMARSNFQAQSGTFSLQIHSLSALDQQEPFRSSPIPAKDEEKAALQQSFRDRESSTTMINSDSKEAPSSAAQQPTATSAAAVPASSLHQRSSGEYYGFALFIFATVLWIVWVVWALTPDEFLQQIGIGWYPNREWAFLIPAWSLVIVLTIYAVFIGINMLKTPELEDLRNVTDSAQNVYRVSVDDERHILEDEKERYRLQSGIYDLPPGYVSRELYLSGPRIAHGSV